MRLDQHLRAALQELQHVITMAKMPFPIDENDCVIGIASRGVFYELQTLLIKDTPFWERPVEEMTTLRVHINEFKFAGFRFVCTDNNK